MRSRLTVASILDVFNFAKKCFKNTERIDRQIQLVSHQGEALGDLDRRLHRSCWKLGVTGKSADWNHTTWKLEDNKHGTVTYSASVCDRSSLHWVNVSRYLLRCSKPVVSVVSLKRDIMERFQNAKFLDMDTCGEESDIEQHPMLGSSRTALQKSQRHHSEALRMSGFVLVGQIARSKTRA